MNVFGKVTFYTITKYKQKTVENWKQEIESFFPAAG